LIDNMSSGIISPEKVIHICFPQTNFLTGAIDPNGYPFKSELINLFKYGNVLPLVVRRFTWILQSVYFSSRIAWTE